VSVHAVDIVNVHRNISWSGGLGFSILDENFVLKERALNVVLTNCTFVILDDSKKHSVATGNRSVHAFVRGELVSKSAEPIADLPTDCVMVEYYPLGSSYFYTADDLSPIWAAPTVWMTNGKAYVR
jgi:hypothetical protein